MWFSFRFERGVSTNAADLDNAVVAKPLRFEANKYTANWLVWRSNRATQLPLAIWTSARLQHLSGFADSGVGYPAAEALAGGKIIPGAFNTVRVARRKKNLPSLSVMRSGRASFKEQSTSKASRACA
jgi:hypothetical protein